MDQTSKHMRAKRRLKPKARYDNKGWVGYSRSRFVSRKSTIRKQNAAKRYANHRNRRLRSLDMQNDVPITDYRYKNIRIVRMYNPIEMWSKKRPKMDVSDEWGSVGGYIKYYVDNIDNSIDHPDFVHRTRKSKIKGPPYTTHDLWRFTEGVRMHYNDRSCLLNHDEMYFDLFENVSSFIRNSIGQTSS